MADQGKVPQEVQEKYGEFRQLRDQIKQTHESVDEINTKLEELSSIIAQIGEIAKIPKNTEILVPISGGIFIKAKTMETGEFLVNVGAKSIIAKEPANVQALLEKQKEELAIIQKEMIHDLEPLQEKAMQLQTELKKMIG